MNGRQRLRIRAAHWAGTAVRFTVQTGRMLLGPAAAAAVSVGAGQLAGHVFGRGLSPWVALTLGGVFALLLARELNSVPPAAPPPGDD